MMRGADVITTYIVTATTKLLDELRASASGSD